MCVCVYVCVCVCVCARARAPVRACVRAGVSLCMCVGCGGGGGGGGAGLMRACVRLIKRQYGPTCPILTTSCDIRHGRQSVSHLQKDALGRPAFKSSRLLMRAQKQQSS